MDDQQQMDDMEGIQMIPNQMQDQMDGGMAMQ